MHLSIGYLVLSDILHSMSNICSSLVSRGKLCRIKYVDLTFDSIITNGELQRISFQKWYAE